MSKKEEVQQIALALLDPSPTNPRKLFDPIEMNELAGSIANNGVQQPIIVRLSQANGREDRFEIVAGERRFRASKIAKQTTIPAIVRALSDEQAEELQIIENLQRVDLAPMEEAKSYEKLEKAGSTIDSIAGKVGKPPAYIAQRLQLIKLPATAQKALGEGKMLLGVALQIARIPTPAMREQAVKRIMNEQRGEDDPIGITRAENIIEQHFMLDLAIAPFDTADAQLVAKAGSCLGCPKRTGNQQALFAEVKKGDICLDGDCHALKVKAHQSLLIDRAKAEGRTVITGDAAKKLQPQQWNDISGFVDIDKERYIKGKSTTLRKAMGKELPPISIFQSPHDKRLLEVISRKDASAHLEDSDGRRTSHNGAGAAARKKERIEKAQRLAIYLAMRAAHKAPELATMRLISAAFFGELNFDKKKAVAIQWAPPYEKKKGSMMEHSQRSIDALEKKIASLKPEEIGRLLVDCCVSGDLAGRGDGDLETIAAHLGVNVARIKKETAAAIAEKKKPKAKFGAAPDKSEHAAKKARKAAKR